MSLPIRHPGDKSSAVTSFETDIYLHRKCNKMPGTYAVYSCVWRLGVVFLEHGGGALGIFKSPVCTYNQAWTFSLSASHYFSFLSKRSGRRMPRAERSALYCMNTTAVRTDNCCVFCCRLCITVAPVGRAHPSTSSNTSFSE